MATKILDFSSEGSCTLNSEIRNYLKEKYSMIVPENMIGGLYRVFFRSFAMMVKYHATKSKHKIGFSFTDDKGVFVIGTILNYETAPAGSEDDGNWVLTMTFDEKDMEGCDEMLNTSSDAFLTIVQTELYNDVRAHCDSNSDLIITITEFVNMIKKYLDANSNDSEDDVTLKMESTFEATVSFENGVKVFSIVPGYSVKQIIKNDDVSEKNEIAQIAKAAFNKGYMLPQYIECNQANQPAQIYRNAMIYNQPVFEISLNKVG